MKLSRKTTCFLLVAFSLILVVLEFHRREYINILILKLQSQMNNARIQESQIKPDQTQHNAIRKPKLPSMALTVRTSSNPKLLKFFFCDLLRSTSLYWSKTLGNMSIILDKESAQDKVLAQNLLKRQKSMGINFNIIYEPLPDSRILKVSNGKSWQYNRQLYSSFIMDNVINTEVIAWIDTDAKFITPVTKENIIRDGKLRVKGMNTFHNSWMKTWDDVTKIMIGYRMPSDFMTYFPVYIWKDTITNCRNYIIKHMKVKNIEEAFRTASQRGYMSPVNVILSYAYYFEQQRYDWHIDTTPTTLKNVLNLTDYNKERLAPGNELNSLHLTPDFHVTLHTKYYKESYNLNKHAYCAAINNTAIKLPKEMNDQCKEFRGKLFWPLFEFCNKPVQGHMNTWCKESKSKCVSLMNNHYNRVNKAVKDGVYDLDLSRVKAVEESAKDMKVTCPAFI